MELDDFNSRILSQIFDKSWKVRFEAYESLLHALNRALDDSDVCFQPWIHDPALWKQGLCDSNVPTQEHAVKSLRCFLDKSRQKGVNSAKSFVVAPLLEKCLPSPRQSIRDASHQALLILAESDALDYVLEGLFSAARVKHPKQAVASIKELNSLLEIFGIPALSPIPFYKLIPTLFAQSDKNIRQEASNLSITLYAWVGNAFKTHVFPQLKQIQVSDLETSFQNVTSRTTTGGHISNSLNTQEVVLPSFSSNAKPKPHLSSKSSLQGSTLQRSTSSFSTPNRKVSQPSDFSASPSRSIVSPAKNIVGSTPVDVLSKLTPEFHTALSSPKWKDRKEALESMVPVCSNPVYQEGDYSELLRVIAKSLKDANVVVVGVAALLLTHIAKALRKGFLPYTGIVLPSLFDRFKERKSSLVHSLLDAANAIFESCGLNDIMDETLEFLKHKNPQVKTETLRWLNRCLQLTDVCPPRASLETLCSLCVTLINDTFEPVRMATTNVLATLVQIFSQPVLSKYIVGLDPKKLPKILELSKDITVNAHPNQPSRPRLPRVASPLKTSPVKLAVTPQAPSPLPSSNPSQASLTEESLSTRSSPTKPSTTSLRSQSLVNRFASSTLKAPSSSSKGVSNAASSKQSFPSSPSISKKLETSRLSTKKLPGSTMKAASALKEYPQQQSMKSGGEKQDNLVTITMSEKVELDLLREEKAIRQVQEAEDALERERLFREINDLQIQNAEMKEQVYEKESTISQKEVEITSLRNEKDRLSTRLQQVLLELEKQHETNEEAMDIDLKVPESGAIGRATTRATATTAMDESGNAGMVSSGIHSVSTKPSSYGTRRSLAGSMLQKPTQFSRPSFMFSPEARDNWRESHDLSSHLWEQIQRMKKA
ncbi:Phosphoprotein p93 [Schizosaccharomyces pombe]